MRLSFRFWYHWDIEYTCPDSLSVWWPRRDSHSTVMLTKHVSVIVLSLKLPLFWPEQPNGGFAQKEAQLPLRNTSSSEEFVTKFYHFTAILSLKTNLRQSVTSAITRWAWACSPCRKNDRGPVPARPYIIPAANTCRYPWIAGCTTYQRSSN